MTCRICKGREPRLRILMIGEPKRGELAVCPYCAKAIKDGKVR